MLTLQRRERPYAVALVSERLTLSFAALDQLVWRLAARFARVDNLSHGAALALCFRSQAAHMIASLAAFRASIPQVSVAQGTPATLGDSLIRRTRAAAIATDATDAAKRFDAPLVEVDLAAMRADRSPIDTSARREAPDAPALYVLGSGTTGTARLLVHTNRGLLGIISREARIWPVRPGERQLLLTPYDYFTSKRRSLAFLSAGGSAVFRDGRAPVFDFCDMAAVDHLTLVVPQAWELLRMHGKSRTEGPRLPRLRSLIVATSPVSEMLRERMRAELSANTWIGYGMNEFGQAAIAIPELQRLHPGCVGRACEGAEIEVVDDEGKALPCGSTGEVRLRAQGVFAGYLDDSESTSRALRDGWFYPGDLGTLTDDGTLIFKGRSDDLMIFDGINVYPREIEAILEQHPGVVEAAAFPVDSKLRNQVPFAAVEVSHPVAEAELLAYCREHLGTHAPVRIHVAEHLPRNVAGKILKRELAKGMRAAAAEKREAGPDPVR